MLVLHAEGGPVEGSTQAGTMMASALAALGSAACAHDLQVTQYATHVLNGGRQHAVYSVDDLKARIRWA